MISIKTIVKKNSHVLSYSPPSYNSFGVPPTQMDPFENNTVEVKQSEYGEGLFSKRDIKKGELICFFRRVSILSIFKIRMTSNIQYLYSFLKLIFI